MSYDPATDVEDEEDVCGGVSPDEMCGQCPDCRDSLDDWRETYDEER